MSKFYFVIDTDKYAGNFEREICAYITAQYGECGVGSKIADIATKELGEQLYNDMCNAIGSEMDDDGCNRPCKIYPTPKVYNNGLGFDFKDGEEELAKEAYLKFAKENPQYKLDDYIKDIIKNGVGKYPAYQSVAIVLYEKPSSDLIRIMKYRAEKFVELCKSGKSEDIGVSKYTPGPDNITGFRLIEERTETTEEAV